MSLLAITSLAAILSLVVSQQLGPIVPTNGNFYGAPYQTGSLMYPGSPYQALAGQHYPIHPANPRQPLWPMPNYGGAGSDIYRSNVQGLSPIAPQPSPTVGIATSGADMSTNPINAYNNQMPSELPSFQYRRASMAPIQVIYGKPAPIESQNEQAAQTSAPSSSSLPAFLQGASDDVVDEYKQIIRKPNSNYDEQVKEIDKLVLRLDGDKQKLYREFMQENDERDQRHRDLIHKHVSEMSSKAQEQFVKISALLRNQELSNEERWGRVLSFYSKMDPSLRNEFEDQFKDFGGPN